MRTGIFNNKKGNFNVNDKGNTNNIKKSKRQTSDTQLNSRRTASKCFQAKEQKIRCISFDISGAQINSTILIVNHIPRHIKPPLQFLTPETTVNYCNKIIVRFNNQTLNVTPS